jgi:putative intracellular protease/amidase
LTTAPVTTAMGLVVVPKYSFANAPAPDLLVVPGGGIAEAMNSEPTLNWIKDVTARDVHTLSVCNGAFFLARAGLLDGLSATTTAGNIDRLATQYPRVHVVRDQRFVDNGKIITAAGLSAGIDGALHAVERMMGAGDAQAVALGLEYPWIPNGGFARASMADEEVPNLDLDTIGNWDWVRTEGDRSRWDMELRATSPLTAAEITDRVGRQLIERGKWVRTGTSGDDSSRTTRWKFTGRDGAAWTAATVVTGVAGADHHYGLKLSLGRAPSSR